MRRARFATLTLALLALAALLGGNTDPSCTPVAPDQPVCLTAHDCEGLLHAECVGEWTCKDAACAWECTGVVQGCYSDADCAADQTCTAATECLPDPGCPMCAVCWGTCEPKPVEPTGSSCWSDADCAEWEWCALPQTYDASGALICCPANAKCTPDVPPCGLGTCQLDPGRCWDDADCKAGTTCQGAITCPPGAWCFAADKAGTCTPEVGEVCHNGLDDDGDGLVDEGCEPMPEICANGLDDDYDGLVDEGCGPACSSDADCKAGYVCEEQAVCPACVYADPPCLAPCYLQAYCVLVDPQPDPCQPQGCSGQVCAAEPVITTCEFWPWYTCYQLTTCRTQADGACGWDQTPEYLDCLASFGQ